MFYVYFENRVKLDFQIRRSRTEVYVVFHENIEALSGMFPKEELI